MKWNLLLIITLVTFSNTTLAFKSGNDLLRGCSAVLHTLDTGMASDQKFGQGYCLGLVNGIRLANDLYAPVFLDQGLPNEERLFCMPVDTELGQVVRVIVNYMNAHPEKLHLEPIELVYPALNRAFPCK